MRRTLAVVIGVLAVLVPALPARAGAPLQWNDASGDATGFLVSPTPLPSEPSLDVTQVRLQSDAKTFTWSAKVQKLTADPPTGATGHHFRFLFTYADTSFGVLIADDAIGGKTTTFCSDCTVDDFTCRNCVGTVDRKAGAVVFRAPIDSLTAAVRQADRSLPPIGPNSRFELLSVVSQRSLFFVTPTADQTAAPEGAAFLF